MTHRKDVVTFADIMENLDQIPKGDPFARGRGPADPLRERAMADALAAPQLAERVRELETECAALRALLVDAHRELATIEAITVSPSGVDGLIELVNRIGQKLESSK
jgi:hypothetical protein